MAINGYGCRRRSDYGGEAHEERLALLHALGHLRDDGAVRGEEADQVAGHRSGGHRQCQHLEVGGGGAAVTTTTQDGVCVCVCVGGGGGAIKKKPTCG